MASSSSSSQMPPPADAPVLSPVIAEPLTPAIIINDKNVAASRPPNTHICHPSQLTMNEKYALQDLLTHYVNMKQKEGMVVVATALYHNFQFLIFHGWTSAVASNPDQALKPRLFTDTSVKVGTLAQDHPLSDAQIKAGLTSQQRGECRCGAPVFIGITLNLDEDYVAYLWRDSKTEFINPRYIRFDPGVTREEARQLAIDNYDQCEQQRIETYNTSKLVNAARRRIVKWAQAGSPIGFPPVDTQDRVDNLTPCVLASDFLINNFEEYKKLVETIQERRSVLRSRIGQFMTASQQ
ncbi:hypothetical protein FALBO_17309 [Fusarium albosuccineum]|uniref:Uncharacterized protein n=1 Tax=Fusarium albosuccineum TaxID=1237068 RepID=A0A8H4K3D9_9HYPO|nr:hypothetical protein FALBO_17309 [Fusarium albosuccineum]